MCMNYWAWYLFRVVYLCYIIFIWHSIYETLFSVFVHSNPTCISIAKIPIPTLSSMLANEILCKIYWLLYYVNNDTSSLCMEIPKRNRNLNSRKIHTTQFSSVKATSCGLLWHVMASLVVYNLVSEGISLV